jgi:pimeloyl-ACP methyl ester carboxylesterase
MLHMWSSGPLLISTMTSRLIVSCVAVAGMVLIAPTAFSAPAAAVDPARGTITWHECAQGVPPGVECGTLTVPLDWDDLSNPANASIELAVNRATVKRMGFLTFNPGGPGESGLDIADVLWEQLPNKIKQRFDFVAWDPRGVGASEPQLDDCLGTRPTSYVPPATGPVDWAALAETTYESFAAALPECLEINEDVAPYLGTYYVIRDLEAMRIALGAPKWNIWGMSYGTRLGYRYAKQYPDRVRTLLLDGAWSPNLTVTSWMNGASWSYATGQAVFASLFGKQMASRFQRVIDGLDEQTIVVDGRTESRWTVLPQIFTNISNQAAFPAIRRVITLADQALTRGDALAAQQLGEPLAELKELASENPNAALNLFYINCRDLSDYPSVAQIARAGAVAAANGSVQSGMLAIQRGSICAGLPQDFTLGYEPLTEPLQLRTAPVVVNSLGDTRTEYVFGRTMANFLAGSSLITYNSTQHVTYLQTPSTCVNRSVTRYLLERKQPGQILCPYAPLLPPAK